jgi:hypothetical protein
MRWGIGQSHVTRHAALSQFTSVGDVCSSAVGEIMA